MIAPKNHIVALLALVTACASTSTDRPVRLLALGPAVEGAVEVVPVPVRPGGLVPRAPSAGALDALVRGEELYYGGELDAAAQTLEAAFVLLEGHPEWLPPDGGRRGVVYRRLLPLYRLRAERGGDGEGLADWLALHLTDQDPSVLSVPPMVEAALSGRRDAVRARSALLSVEVRAPEEWEVYLDGRRLGAAPLRRIEIPAGLHAVEVRREAESSWVRHRVVVAGENRVVIEPALDRALVLEEGRGAAVNGAAPLPLKLRAVGWLAMAAGAEVAPLLLKESGEVLLVVPGGGFVRPLPDGGVTFGALQPPGRWRPWTALGLGIGAAAAGVVAAVFAGLRNQAVRDLNASPFQDTRPRIRRLEAGAWGALGMAAGLSLGAGGVGLWHALDRGSPALRDLPSVD
ncbi:MAG: PEGA domain-containing protein [Pseudomonadota bacterium]